MNVASDTALIAHLQKAIRSLCRGFPPDTRVLADIHDSALVPLAGEILHLARLCEESRAFVLALAQGNLEVEAPPRNNFVAPYKELQAELRHLTWQIQEIAKGDLGQQISFSGDLARALNAMMDALREKTRLDEENRASARALEELNARLAEMATMDSLTGILNRRSFDQRLGQEILRVERFGGRFSLLMFDVDNFKAFNDTCGHAIGDLVLVSLCGLVGLNIRQVDGFYRFGGEEFMIILTESSMGQALAVAEHLRALVEDLAIAQAPAQLPRVTVSFGVCCSDQLEELDAKHLMRAVDQALYEAKSAGRNCVRAAG